jgi:hypothetical protein
MLWDPAIPWPAPYNTLSKASPPSIRFLFNPSTVEASYQITDATAQAAIIYPVTTNGPQPVLRVPLQQQIGFTIMFDRTYEVNGALSSDVNQLGVDVDIRCVKQFTGMFSQVYAGTGSGNGNNPFVDPTSGQTVQGGNVNTTNGSGTGLAQGIMQMALAYVYFGAPGKGLQYYGYIDSWDVQYTHFAANMVPMRAVVDISFTLLPPPQINTPSSAAASIAKEQVGPGQPIHLGPGQI